ncbi:MAG: hypothetical protein Q4B65_00315 [Candidatus Saccharibacteria bacterium]|nr:hypothetical protein [Candidatus Saccharibacteria bacterium]
MRKDILRKCFAWIGVFLILVATVIVPYFSQGGAYAAVSYADAAKVIEKASRIQRITNAVKLCTKSDDRRPTGSEIDIRNATDYWYDYRNVNIAAGPWLEAQVQGEPDDGEIWCTNHQSKNILQLFADYLGYDLSVEVACYGTRAGILEAYSNGTYVTSDCANLIDDEGFSFHWREESYSLGHLKFLYEKYKTDNPEVGIYLPSWDDVGNYENKAVAYYIYFDDYKNACTDGTVYEGNKSIMPKDVYWEWDVPLLNAETGKYDVWRNFKKVDRGVDGYNWDSSVVGDSAGARTCDDVNKKLRDYGQSAQIATISLVDYLDLKAESDAKENCNNIAENGLEGQPETSVRAQLELATKIIDDPDFARTTVQEQYPDLEGEELEAKITEVTERAQEVKNELAVIISSSEINMTDEEMMWAGIDPSSVGYWEYGTGDKAGQIVCKDWPTVWGGRISPESGYQEPEVTITDPSGGTVEPVPQTCANSGGAASLGWIVCPIMEWMGESAQDIYEGWLEPALQIKPTLFDPAQNGGQATKSAWEIFQGIANICFIILFLVVIFSQLTGVGIDNYGIKRILPKLIITAVLVNLSYYICTLAVDLSNILGSSLQDLFNNIPVSAPDTFSISFDGDSGGNIGTGAGATVITGVVLLLGLVTMVGTIWTNPAILLSLLVGALGVLIAILFLFILLEAREVAIIVLMVLSPLAFICYMLPNTKKLFDKWLGMGKGLLLVYPIAGLLIGGGNFVSKLLLQAGMASQGFIPAFTAMIAGVIPIFFIPGVLKSSFAALGNLGAKISGFGANLRNRADRGIRNSEGYKNAQQRGMERKKLIRAGLDKDGNVKNGRFARLMSMGPGQNRRRAEASGIIDKNHAIDRYSDANFLAAKAASRQAALEDAEVKDQEALIRNSGITDDIGKMQKNYENALLGKDADGNDVGVNQAAIRAYQNLLSAKGDKGREAVHQAVKRAEAGGASQEALRYHASNLVNNHGAAYKADSRSTFNHANEILGGGERKMADFENSASLVDSVKDSTMGSMDDEEFKRMVDAASADPVKQQELYDAAYNALQNEMAMAGTKNERKVELQKLAANSTLQKAQSAGNADEVNFWDRKTGDMTHEEQEYYNRQRDNWEQNRQNLEQTGRDTRQNQ